MGLSQYKEGLRLEALCFIILAVSAYFPRGPLERPPPEEFPVVLG
jgi:hypothetical protein